MQIARRVLCPSEDLATNFTRKVFSDIPNLLRGSNIRWRGKSFAAAVPSEIAKGQKARKKVSKDDRQAMVETFVNKYRAMNAGKFPTVTLARTEVGGSYYVIRKILQELEYKSRISSSNPRNEHLLRKEVDREHESLTEFEEVSDAQKFKAVVHEDAHSSAVNDVDICDSSVKYFESKAGLQTSIMVEKTSFEEVSKPKTADHCAKYVAAQSHLQNSDATEESYPYLENSNDDVKQNISEEMLDFHGLKNPTADQRQQSSESDKLEGDSSEKQKSDEELSTKSSIWGNLKSLADGFMNMWRKS